ncbi:uncharacterized protein METZ01_LOCUS366251, partial [marine metagenome]
AAWPVGQGRLGAWPRVQKAQLPARHPARCAWPSARQPARHRCQPGGQVSGAGKIRPRPHRPGQAGQNRSDHRPRRGDSPCDAGTQPPHEEQPGAHRRAGRRQDRHRRGPGPAHRQRRRPGVTQQQDADRDGSQRDDCRREVSRRIRGSPQGVHQGNHLQRRSDYFVHRRTAHARRRRRRRGRNRCRQHAQAATRPRRTSLHRRDHARRVPQTYRERPRPRAPLPAGESGRANRRGLHRHFARTQGTLRGAPRHSYSGHRTRHRRNPVRPLHHRPVFAGQGDRPHRRGGGAAADGTRLDADRDRPTRAA